MKDLVYPMPKLQKTKQDICVRIPDFVFEIKNLILSPYLWSLTQRNRLLYRRHANQKRCFVIGNGPSLKSQDIKLLKNEFTIVANSFFFHPDHSIVNPKCCCVADTEHTSGEPHSIAWLREMEKCLPNTTLFFRPSARQLFLKEKLFVQHNVFYINGGYRAPTNISQVEIRLTRSLNIGLSTGTSFAIPLAIYLGFSEIYLIGMDSNWLADIHEGELHFYDQNPYFPHFERTSSSGQMMEDELWAIYADFVSHRWLRDKALSMGIKIFNATNGGWLDMYPRINYNSLF